MTKKKNKYITPKYTSHHLRSKSRGGADDKVNESSTGEVLDEAYPANERRLHNDDEHVPFHRLFATSRVAEALTNLLFNWGTINPFKEKNETNTWENRTGFKGRKKAWEKLFKDNRTQKETIIHILSILAYTAEDIRQCKRILSFGVLCEIIDESFREECIGLMNDNLNKD